MRLVLLGPPGAGKGTQAELIKNHFNIPHVSTGDMLREARHNKTQLGRQAEKYMEAGELVPDSVVIGIVQERLAAPDCKRGFLLDGFPRTVEQAQALEDSRVQLDAVINIQVHRDLLVKRLSGRRICKQCGKAWHMEFNPPFGHRCDCGGELYQRSDDASDTVNQRLDVYLAQTSPLIQWYQQRNLLITIDGAQNIDVVFAAILAALGAD